MTSETSVTRHPLRKHELSPANRWLGSAILWLLAVQACLAGPVISEFLAANGSSLADEDGTFSDWIEIHNPDANPLDLNGWHLTDNAAKLTKWRFPATVINPGGYLVVFASEKNRSGAGAHLHTNFKLSSDGEYLALVAPDGITVASQFAPLFPQQFSNISYGSDRSTGVITTASPIVTGHAVRYLVPKLGEPAGDWRMMGFDDSAWSTASTGLGFDYPDFPIGAGGDLSEAMRDAAHGTIYVRLPFQITNPAEVTSMMLRMKVDDGFVAWLNGHPVASKNAPSPAGYNSLATSGTEIALTDAFESHPLDFSGHVLPGTNLLAIHGMNLTHGGSDFLLIPELDVRLADLSVAVVNGYFERPTPGAPNGTAVPGYIKDTQFSVKRGFFTAPFPLEITSETPGVEIRYTTDGSAPTESHGNLYSGPVPIDKTTTLQAAAFRSGYRPTNIDTQTYIFISDVERQPRTTQLYWDTGMDPDVVNKPGTYTTARALADIPTLSIVMDPNELFGTTAGIYTHATQEAAINPKWEKKCSAEYFYHPDYAGIYRVADGFQIDCGIAISGNFSRLPHNPKHSFRLKFKEEYGKAKLEFPIFPTSSVDEYDTLTIRTGHNQGWATGILETDMLRDQHSRDIQGFDPAQPVSDGNHVHLYLNGKYWGIYFLSERPDDAFGAEHWGGQKEQYDGFKGLSAGGSSQAEIIAGNRTAWAAMYALAAQDTTDPAKYLAIQQYLDIDQLIDYTIGTLYQGDLDGPTGLGASATQPKNFYAMRRRHTDGRFRFYRWDAEFIFGSTSDDVSDRSGTENPANLHFRLRRNADYKRRFADRVHKYFFNGGKFTVAEQQKFYLARAAQVSIAMVAESARWGDSKREPPFTRDVHWVNERNRVTNSWMPGRHNIILNQFKADGLYPPVAAPSFSINAVAKHGGPISSADTLSLTAAQGAIYFSIDGTDPRGNGTPDPARLYSAALTIPSTAMVKARAFFNNTWSALNEALFLVNSQPAAAANLKVSAVDYQPANPTPAEEAEGWDQRKDFEFIELLNPSSSTVDLAAVAFTHGILFKFDTQSTIRHLLPGQRILIVKCREAFALRYPAVNPSLVAGEFSQRLDDNGDEIVLTTSSAAAIARFRYNDKFPWPVDAGGGGHSLVLIRPETNPDPADPASWRASVSRPTPGSEDRTRLSSWLTANGLTDPNAVQDGSTVNNAVVYALGADLLSDPADALPKLEIAAFTVNNITADYLTIAYNRRAGADDVQVTPQISSDLSTWVSGEPAATVTVSRRLNGDGTEITVVREVQPMTTRRYVRLSVRTL